MPTNTGNPFIDMVFGGKKKPTTTDFLSPLNGLPMNGLPTGSTPAFNPSAPDPRSQAPSQKPGVMGKLDSFMGTQGGGLLMNLLAQSGYSTMPQSPFGAIGRASLANQEQQQMRGMSDLQRQLIESQIGLNQANADPQNISSNVNNIASTFEGENGNVWAFRRGSTDPVDTGVPFRKARRFEENADGSITLYGEDGQRLKTVRTPEEARTQELTGAETDVDVENRKSAPGDIKTAESTLFEVGNIKRDVDSLLKEVGITTTGAAGAVLQFVPGFKAKDFAVVRERVTSFLSLDKIAEMKAQSQTGATGLGAVNEREFDALSKARANLDQAQSPAQMAKSLRELLFIIDRVERIAAEDIAKAKQAGGQAASGFEIIE